MSTIQAQDEAKTCVLCFWAKRACAAGGKHCCLRSRPYQSPDIGEDTLGSGPIAKLRVLSETQQMGLARDIPPHSMLECQPTYSATDSFTLSGPVDASNRGLVAQLDRMVLNTWSPKIQAQDEAMNSTSSACLGIGYCNMLIYMKIQDNSEPSFYNHNLSPIMAEIAIIRINGLIATNMSLIRRAQSELDVVSRSWLILWYLYLSIMHSKLRKQDRCELFDDPELLKHVREIFASLRKELRAHLAVDCKNKPDWAAPFKESQRSLVEKLRVMEPRTLSVKWLAWSMPALEPLHHGPQQEHYSSNPSLGTTSASQRLGSRPTVSSNIPAYNSNWVGSNNTNVSTMGTAGLSYEQQATFADVTGETTDLSFNQNIDINSFADQYDFTPRDPEQDDLRAYHTFHWH